MSFIRLCAPPLPWALLGPWLLLASGCSPSVAALESELDAATDSQEIAEVIRALVLEKGERGARAVEAFDARRLDCAFDAEHSILVLFDVAAGSLHYEEVGRRQTRADTGDADLDAALDAAIAKVVPDWDSVLLRIPAQDFRELVQIERPQGPLFVVKQAGASVLHGLACPIEDGRLASWTFVDVDPETLRPIPR